MKIIQFVPTLANGGAEALVRDYAIALNKLGYDVKVLVTKRLPDSSNEKTLKSNSIRIDSIEPFFENSGNIIGKIFAMLFRCLRLICYLHIKKPHVIHVHLTLLHLMYLCRYFIPRNMLIVYTCHSVPKVYFEKYKKEYFAAVYFLKRGNFKLIALHKDAALQMNRIFNCSDTACLHNMIDLKRFRHPMTSRKDMRKQLGIAQDAFVIGHIGRFSEVKNHNFLVEIFASVIKEKPNAFLLMIGDGDLKEHVETKLSEMGLKNKYLILSNRYDIPELDHTMDVCVFPSKYEGFLIAMLEAQACGIKCVCSCNIPSTVFLSKNIYALSLDDSINKWKDAILYNNMPPSASTGKLEDYDTNTIIKQLEQIYKE